MKLISTLILLTSISLSYAQTAKAPLNVIVTNKQGERMPNDKITFIGRDSKQEIVGITNEKGYFKVHIPAGDEYFIKVEVIGEPLTLNRRRGVLDYLYLTVLSSLYIVNPYLFSPLPYNLAPI